jgi:hypothetical protein
MRKLRYAVALNVGVVLGCFLALYLVPDTTPMWFFALMCFVAIVAINLSFFLGPRLRKKTGTPTKASAFRSVMIWTMLVLGLLGIVLQRLGLVSW